MKYQYTRSPAFSHLRGGMPLTEIALYHGGHEITVPALVDSGAAMSVLPYDVGLELGLAWEEQTVPVDVGGVLKNASAYGVLVRGEISPLPPVCVGFRMGGSCKRSDTDDSRTDEFLSSLQNHL